MNVYTSICTYVIYCYTYWVDICMYMQVYASICMYIIYLHIQTVCKFVYACIWTYMMVFEGIWRICTHYICIRMYYLEWHQQTLQSMPRPRKTLSVGGNWRATLKAPQVIWASTLFSRWQRLCRPDLAHPTPRHASWAHEAPLSFRTEVSNARSAHYNPVSWRATADLSSWSPSRCPRASAAPPRKHLSTVIGWCMYMDVYVCICMYMYIQ